MYFTPNAYGLKKFHDAITLVVIKTKFAQVFILAKLFFSLTITKSCFNLWNNHLENVIVGQPQLFVLEIF